MSEAMKARAGSGSIPSALTMARTHRSRSKGSSTPPRSKRMISVAATGRSASDDDAWRWDAVGGHEEVGHQRRVGIDAVFLEVPLALGIEEAVVDQEVTAEALGRLFEDGVGRIAHDLDGAAGLHALVAGQREPNG